MRLNTNLKLLLILFIVCFSGILISGLLIDKKIESYVAEMQTNVNINVEVINNLDNDSADIEVKQDKDNIKIYINPKEDSTTVIENDDCDNDIYVQVTSKRGLNIRENPTVESEKVGVLNYGDSIQILSEHNGWYLTEFGFICKKFTIKI